MSKVDWKERGVDSASFREMKTLLNIELFCERESHDCIEDFVASTASWWNRGHELMYANSWNFCFNRRQDPGDTLGSRIAPLVNPSKNLLEKHHGIKISEIKNLKAINLVKLVQCELTKRRPIILGRTHSNDEVGNIPLFFLVVGINTDIGELYYLHNKIDVVDENVHEIESMPIGKLANWQGYCTTLEIVGEETANFDWREVIESSHLQLLGSSASDSSFYLMRCFAEEVKHSLDIGSETSGYSNGFWVPLFYNTLRVSQGRVQFSKMLQYLTNRFQIAALGHLSADLASIGQEWNIVRSMFVKSSIKPGDRDLVDRIARRIEELAVREEGLANSLKETAADKVTHTRIFPSFITQPVTLRSSRFERPRLENPYVGPRNDIEKSLAKVWQDVLRIKQVGVHDNFFDLGGDSLLFMQITTIVSQSGLQLTPNQIYQHQTIAELAHSVGTAPEINAEQGIVTGSVPLTPGARQFLERKCPDIHHYNESAMFEVREILNEQQLECVVRHWVAHHDALRLRFIREESGWKSVIVGMGDEVPMEWLDLSHLKESEHARAIEMVAAKRQGSLNLYADRFAA